MDDLSGLSWGTSPATSAPAAQSQQQQQPVRKGNGPTGHAFMGMGGGILQPTPVASPKVKPPVPPVSSKPAHLQMGYNHNGAAGQQPLNSLNSKAALALAQQPNRQPSSSGDVFGSLIPDFGNKDRNGGSSAGLNKSLENMSLDERRRHLQQQQQQSRTGSTNDTAATSTANRWDDFSMLANSLRSTSPSPSPSSPFRSTTTNGNNTKATSTTTPLSTFNPNGIQAPIPMGRPLPGFLSAITQTSTASRGQSPATSSALLTPLVPSRSPSSSPAPVPKDPFESLLGSNQSSSRSTPSMNQSLNTLRANTPPVHQQAAPAQAAADPWDLDFLANTGSTTTNKTNGAASQEGFDDTFDLGAFEKAVPEGSSAPPKPPRPSQVASPSAPSSPPSSASSRRQGNISSPSSVNSSSKDSLVALIVDMGFSAQQAKMALAMTPSGNDVEAAIDLLVQNKAADEELGQSGGGQKQQQQRQRERTGESRRNNDSRHAAVRRNVQDDEDDEPALTDRRRRQQQRRQQPQDGGEYAGATARTQQFQQQKDRFVETASAFGMSVLSKASGLYKQGKEKMQAVMEDMGAEDERTARLRQHQWVEEDERGQRQRTQYTYRDSSDSEEEADARSMQSRMEAAAPLSQPRRELVDDYYDQQSGSSRSPAKQQQRDAPTPSSSRRVQERENFEGTYVSSSRRGGSTRQTAMDLLSSGGNNTSPSPSTRNVALNLSAGSTPAAKRQQPPVTPIKKPERPPRTLVQASPQQLEHSSRLKEKGNELFKLGQFGQAAEMYAQAIQALPPDHLTLIVLHNNRAAALIKTGEYRETIEVCSRSMTIIHGPDGQGVNDVVPASAGVNLKEQLAKSLTRRATALENLEKYKEAKKDWTQLREQDPNNRQAIEGLRRCDKAIQVTEGEGSGASTPQLRKATISSPSLSHGSGSRVSSSPLQDMYASVQSSVQQAKNNATIQASAGVSKLREAARQQEREEDEKLRLRDQVDQRMAQWKAGKEDNLRALIASLHTVLWESAGWKAVGLHELVTTSQVKVKYMRAIGKMHPDKLGAQTTVEQRMMANTIFSTLNSAWDAFKVQNNM